MTPKNTKNCFSYDLDSLSANLSEHDFLGRFDCDLAEIVSAIDGVLTGNLT